MMWSGRFLASAVLVNVVACGARRATPEPLSDGVQLVVLLEPPLREENQPAIGIVAVRPVWVNQVEWSAPGTDYRGSRQLERALAPANPPIRVPVMVADDALPGRCVVQGTVHARGRLGTPIRQTFCVRPSLAPGPLDRPPVVTPGAPPLQPPDAP